MTDLSNPRDYYAFPAVGSSAVIDWLEDEKRGSFDTWRARYVYLPRLDARRSRGDYSAPLGQVKIWELARRESSLSMRAGSMIEARLFSEGSLDEWEHASEDATPDERAEAKDKAAAIAACCPTVRALRGMVDKGAARTQVAEVAFVESVPCKSRQDLVWRSGEVLVETDLKIYTQWHDARSLWWRIKDRRAMIQRAHYENIREANHPGEALASSMLVVNPGGSGQLPFERMVPRADDGTDEVRREADRYDEEMAAAKIEVSRALRGIKELLSENMEARIVA